MNETETIEFKEKTERGIREGNRWLFKHSTKRRPLHCVDGDGIPVGIEDINGTELQIKDRIKNN